MTLTRRKFLKRGAFIAGGLLLAESFLYEKFWIEKNEYSLNEGNNSTIKFIQLTDLHLSSYNPALPYIAEYINTSNIDFVVLTGDSIESADGYDLLDEFLGQINKSIPKVSILGNWEYWGQVDIVKLGDLYARHNCRLLINESMQWKIKNKTISIVGTDDWRCGEPDIELALKEYKKGDFNLLLTHCPVVRDQISDEVYKESEIDLVLSGHTHGGQLNLFGFAPVRPAGSGKYVKGWYKDKTPHLYVSKGIGTSRIPLRIGARAEIAVFKF